MDESEALQLLNNRFGFSAFRQGQWETIQALDRHRAALAVFPTGAGKSLCYQLPALNYEGLTLVVSPLIALMKDQIDFLTSHDIPAARLDSALTKEETRDIYERAENGALKLLYVAPERFNNERFLNTIRRLKIGLFAIDEAHCISEWGHNFRPDYMKLAEAYRSSGAERILALTATATPQVVSDIRKAFAIPEEAAIVTGFYRKNLLLGFTPVNQNRRDDLLVQRLLKRKPGPTIVYVTLQRTAEQVAERLQQASIPAQAYHAGMDPEERTRVQNWWKESDSNVVVATIAFGMGIDKSDVRYVYHYNLPKSLESYSQEIGRAGRDELPSIVEMFPCPNDLPTLMNFVYGDTPTRESIQALTQELLADAPLDFSADPEGRLVVEPLLLSRRFDLRPLVLQTILTYLELLGALQQGTPFYAGYAFREQRPLEEILAQFPGEPGRFVAKIFEQAPLGKRASWHRLQPDEACAALGCERRRLVRALEVLESRGLIELTVSDLRQQYRRLLGPEDIDRLAEELYRRFQRREDQEIRRLNQVIELVTADSCQANRLAAHFGEQREEPCGNCSYCRSNTPKELPEAEPLPPLAEQIPWEELDRMKEEHPQALGTPRQAARLFCGLTSPALTAAKLSSRALFGSLQAYPFQELLGLLENYYRAGVS